MRVWVAVAVAAACVQLCVSQDGAQPDGQPEPPAEVPEAEVAVALPPPGEPIVLSDESFDQLASNTEILMVNFYANWCRFSQMLKPVYAASAAKLSDEPRVRLGSIDCEAHDTTGARERNHITKYPTIKVYRRGVPLKSEYRGQRSPDAIAAYVRELLAEPVLTVNNNEEVDGHINKHRRVIIGHFNGPEHEHMGTYESIAARLRDDCHFLMYKSSPLAGEGGANIVFKSKMEEASYDGDKGNTDALLEWATEHCSPLVREITFQNGEELTEEGLPFLILFYSPDDHSPVSEFTKAVKERLAGERGQINFITADGNKFAHPLRHLGKSKKDLPILAFDTFKHMYLFKRFSDIHKGDKLEQFVRDLHSGKLHHNFHHPQAEPEEPDEKEEPKKADEKNAETLAEKVEKAEAQKNPQVPEELTKPTEEHHDEEDDPSKPVPVKSVLKNLKPNSHRYSIIHNEF